VRPPAQLYPAIRDFAQSGEDIRWEQDVDRHRAGDHTDRPPDSNVMVIRPLPGKPPGRRGS
jgi:hypothetical protein